MGFRTNIYLRDNNEREVVKVALAAYRSARAGLPAEIIDVAVSSGVSVAEKVEPILERAVPHTLQRFIDDGWDLDTAFRIYDEWNGEMNSVTDKQVNIKSLPERFKEERMKRDADEGAE